MTDLRPDSDGTHLGWLGNEQPEMEAEHTLVGTSMRRQVLAGREDREERGLHARYLLEELGCFRTAAAIPHRLHTVGVEEEGFPAVVLGEYLLFLRPSTCPPSPWPRRRCRPPTLVEHHMIRHVRIRRQRRGR